MKKTILAVLVATLLFVVACSSGPNTDYTSPYIGGTKALELSFLPQSPPDEIFDSGKYDFAISVQVKNPGEDKVEVNDGFIRIDGISPSEFNVTANDLKKPIPVIEPAKKDANGNIIDGGLDVVTFEKLNYRNDIPGTLNSVVVRAIACYDYTTKSVATICVKKEAIDFKNQNEVCDIAGPKEVANSGGPIHITRVTENSQGRNGVQVTFEVSFQGDANDEFFKQGTQCDIRNQADRYKVFIDVKPIVANSISAKCSGLQDSTTPSSGYITMQNNAVRPVTCTFDTTSVQNDFVTQVNVDLKYRYMQYIEKPLLIKDIS